jgi:hypothetical protein
MVTDQGLCRCRIDSALGEQRAEGVDGLRPKRAHALFAAFAAEADLERAHELEVAWPDVENLLHAGSGVEEREEERVIATTVRSRAVWSIEDSTDLASLEILDETRPCPLEGHGEDALAELHLLGPVHHRVARERMNSSEAGVARRCAVFAFGLEVVEEGQEGVGGEVLEVELDDGTPATRGEKSQQEHERVAVAAHGVGTHAADSR